MPSKYDLDDKETMRHLDEIFGRINDPSEIEKKRIEKIRKQIIEDKEANYCL